MVILVATQLLLGMRRFWLPHFILRRSMERRRLRKTIGYLRPAAQVIDKVVRPRLVSLTRPPFEGVAAVLCLLAALSVPPLEVVRFVGTLSWAAIAEIPAHRNRCTLLKIIAGTISDI